MVAQSANRPGDRGPEFHPQPEAQTSEKGCWYALDLLAHAGFKYRGQLLVKIGSQIVPFLQQTCDPGPAAQQITALRNSGRMLQPNGLLPRLNSQDEENEADWWKSARNLSRYGRVHC